MKNSHGMIIVFVASVVSSIIAWYLSFQNNYILTYNDAASHLNIARRVIDSLTPGFAQIGTVWLPLPHVLMIPFAWNDFLWHTGLAGSIVSMIAYVASAIFLYKMLVLVTRSSIAGIIGASVLILNPNLLYMQTTPMTETLLIASIIIAIYFFTKYISTHAINDLILCSLFVACSTLIRYDGWFLFIVLSLSLPFWMIITQNRKRAESTLILFLVAGGFGIFLWFLWNLVIFGDPLYFISGPFSAAAQQKVLDSVGQLPTKGNVLTASFYYMWAVIENNGIYLVIAASIGALLLPFFVKKKTSLLIALAIFSPIIFNIIALYLGQSALNVMQASQNPGLFNIRYGMMALPAIAFVLGVIAVNKYLRLLIIGIIFFQSYLFINQGLPITLVDGQAGLKNTYYTIEASKWLRENYQGGLILTSLASHDAFVARTQIPIKNYIHEGTREYWDTALNNPGKDATYIATLSFPPDLVYKKIYKNPDFLLHFKKVHEYGKFAIYKKI